MRYFSTLSLLFLFTLTHAQLKFGPTVGVNMVSNHSNERTTRTTALYQEDSTVLEKQNFTIDGKLGLNLGFFVSYPLLKKVEVLSGLSYETVNGKSTKRIYGIWGPGSGLDGSTYSRKTHESYTYSYLNIPLLFNYKIPVKEGSFLLILGGQYSLGLAGKGEITSESFYLPTDKNLYAPKPVTYEIDYSPKASHQVAASNVYSDTNGYFFSNNISLCGGIGYEYKSLAARLYYTYGLTNTVASSDYNSFKNHSYLHGFNVSVYWNILSLHAKEK